MNIQGINFSNFIVKKTNKTNNNFVRFNQGLKSDVVEFSSKPISFRGQIVDNVKAEAASVEAQVRRISQDAIKIADEASIVKILADDVIDDSVKVLNKAQVLLKEINSYLAEGAKTNNAPVYNPQTGRLLRAYYEASDDQFVMAEYTDGWNHRKTIVSKDHITVVSPGEKVKNAETFIFDRHTGNLVQYSGCLQNYDFDDGYSANEQYVFNNGELICFDRGHNVFTGRFCRSSEHYDFQDGSLKRYCFNWKKDNSGPEEAQEVYEYNDELVYRHFKKVKIVPEKSKTAEEEYIYLPDGSLVRYCHDIQDVYGRGYRSKLVLHANKGGVRKVEINRTSDSKRDSFVEKLFKFKDNRPSELICGYAKTPDGCETYESKTKL